jgi:hypothetical protein
MLFFEFPEAARWNAEGDCVEFSVILRPYEGTVRITRRVFQGSSTSVRRPSDAWRRSTSSTPGSR